MHKRVKEMGGGKGGERESGISRPSPLPRVPLFRFLFFCSTVLVKNTVMLRHFTRNGSKWELLANMHEPCPGHRVHTCSYACEEKQKKKKKNWRKPTNTLLRFTYGNWQHSWLQCSPSAEWKIPAMTEHGAWNVCVRASGREGGCVCVHIHERERGGGSWRTNREGWAIVQTAIQGLVGQKTAFVRSQPPQQLPTTWRTTCDKIHPLN